MKELMLKTNIPPPYEPAHKVTIDHDTIDVDTGLPVHGQRAKIFMPLRG